MSSQKLVNFVAFLKGVEQLRWIISFYCNLTEFFILKERFWS